MSWLIASWKVVSYACANSQCTGCTILCMQNSRTEEQYYVAYRSGAAARALMLYEMWLRHAKHNKLKNTARSSAGTPFSHDQVRLPAHL